MSPPRISIVALTLVVTTIVRLSSSVGAFLSSSASQSIASSHKSTLSSSLYAAFIDESYPNAPTGSSTKNNQINPIIATDTNKPSKTLPNGGKITLVGAGPGSPDLLTLAAHKIITDPNNLLIVDRLVSQEILDLIQGEYKVANKYPGCAEQAQKEIYDWCKDGLREGRHVVRLKIGEF